MMLLVESEPNGADDSRVHSVPIQTQEITPDSVFLVGDVLL